MRELRSFKNPGSALTSPVVILRISGSRMASISGARKLYGNDAGSLISVTEFSWARCVCFDNRGWFKMRSSA